MSENQPQVIDPYKSRSGYVEATDWAIPYWASYLEENRIGNPEMFSHVNCSYLSTPGRPVTLAALKKHAQSLTHLISTIAPSQGAGEINNANSADPIAREFVRNEAFDWLNNLEEVYNTDDPDHHRPLNSLVNQAKANSDTKGVEFFCPLEKAETKESIKAEDIKVQDDHGEKYQKERNPRPWARHWNLLRHANECLEILDHEFSATGGLLSILPTEHEVEAEQLDLAKNTLIGQWLLFTQQLVARMHDIEISYANSLDLLSGEAIIPMQHMSVQGPDGRSGRELVFPQDRWVLANAGEDVMTYIHQVLDKKQLSEEHTARAQRAVGVSGEKTFNAATDSERGIVSVDLVTRFYRIKGSASDRGPIFILPAFGDRPGTKYTRMMEDRPTVVAVMRPQIPDEEGSNMVKKCMEDEETIDNLTAENKDLRNRVRALEEEVEKQRQTAEREKIKSSHLLSTSTNLRDVNGVVDQVEHLRKQLAESIKKEQEQTERANTADKLYKDLLSNEYTQTKAANTIPRDIDGQATENALKALLTSLKKAAADNNQLKARIAKLQEGARGQSRIRNGTRQ